MRPSPNWKAFLGNLCLYAVLVLTYSTFVLHYLAGWLKELYDHDRRAYAVVAILLMIGQAVGLEVAGSFLFELIRRKRS